MAELPIELYHKSLHHYLHQLKPEVYPEVDSRTLREIKSEEIRNRYSLVMQEIVKPYHQSERETWFTQLSEAEAWTANNDAQTPMLQEMATVRGISLELMVAKVLENNALFRQAVGQVLGAQQAELDELYAE